MGTGQDSGVVPYHMKRSPDQKTKESRRNMVVINNPLTDLPKLSYEVDEEQPPYFTGNQSLATFTKLFIHNIDYTVTRDGILRTFNQFGRIRNINMPFNSRKRPRGLAFIIYETHSDAKRALQAGQNGIVIG